MVMFETVAVVLMALTIEKEERDGRHYNGRLLVVMALLLFAGYTKQLAYATVAAVFIFWFIRQPKRAVMWAIPFAAVTGLVFLWIDWSTDGWWMVNTVTANINPFIREQAIGLFRQWFKLHTVITVAALLLRRTSSILNGCRSTACGLAWLCSTALRLANGARASLILPRPSPPVAF